MHFDRTLPAVKCILIGCLSSKCILMACLFEKAYFNELSIARKCISLAQQVHFNRSLSDVASRRVIFFPEDEFSGRP
jgi:hypothetical protein